METKPIKPKLALIGDSVLEIFVDEIPEIKEVFSKISFFPAKPKRVIKNYLGKLIEKILEDKADVIITNDSHYLHALHGLSWQNHELGRLGVYLNTTGPNTRPFFIEEDITEIPYDGKNLLYAINDAFLQELNKKDDAGHYNSGKNKRKRAM